MTALRRMDCTLAQAAEGLRMYPQVMVNVPLQPGVDWKSHAGLKDATRQVEQMLDGRGRVLIRASGTEPKLRLMVEAEAHDLAQQGVEQLVAVNLTTQ